MNKIYFINAKCLKNDKIFTYFYTKSHRKDKISKLLRKQDKQLSLLAETLLNFGLKRLGIIEYSIYYNNFGKPFLKGLPFYFSLSHSKNFVLCAISDKYVGCDIEYIDTENLNIINIAKKFFSNVEFQRIQSSKNRILEFYDIWTKKESYIKMIGIGLNAGINFSLNNEIIINNEKYYIQNLKINDNYKSAICSAFKNYNLIEVNTNILDLI